MSAFFPIAASERLAAVRRSGLLDTPADEAFDRLADLAATLLDARYAFVTVVDEERSYWKSCIGIDATGLARQNSVEESFCQYVVGSGDPLLVGDARLDPLTRDNPSIASMGVIAWAGFPLRSPDGHVLGSFCVVDDRPRQWSARDASVLGTLTHAAAGEVVLRQALEQAQQASQRALAHAEEAAQLASTLQQSLLPRALPQVSGADVAARYRAGGRGLTVTGDFYDVFPTEAPSWAVVLGDVCGHGAEAARIAALARYTVRAAALVTASPSEVLRTLNEALLAQAEDDERFLTALYASCHRDGDSLRVVVSCGGHPPPLLRHADGTVEPVTGLEGTLLGCSDEVDLVDATIRLEPGDSLLLYTDGITEARHGGGELFGEDRLSAALAGCDGTPAELAQAVERAALEHAGGTLVDDAAVLVIQVPTPRAPAPTPTAGP